MFYAVRIIFVKRHLGVSPVFTGKSGTLHWATHSVFRFFRLLILGVCLVRLTWPAFDGYLLIFDGLWHPGILILGCCLLLAGFSTIIGIHAYIGENWRSGIRADDRNRLITAGPFKLSRNPMMICVIVGQVGLFLALPSMFTLVCLVLGVWAVAAQVQVEEKALKKRFGAEYERYREHTPRWLIFR